MKAGRNGVSYGTCDGSECLPVCTADGHIRKLRDIEADLIRLALTHYGGNCRLAAEQLRIGRGTLYRKMKELGIMQIAE